MTARPFKARIAALSAVAAACGLLAATAPPAGATSATATLTGGSLGFVGGAPGSVSFSDILNGTDQTVTTPQAIDVSDATGSGTGWNITANGTTFATAGNTHTLPNSVVTIASTPSVSCDSTVTCTVATTTSPVSYPYTLPMGATAPTATRMFNANAGTGMGDQTVTPTWSLTVPANAYAGTYTSTWTISLVSAP